MMLVAMVNLVVNLVNMKLKLTHLVVVPCCQGRPITGNVIALEAANSLADELGRVRHRTTYNHITAVKHKNVIYVDQDRT